MLRPCAPTRRAARTIGGLAGQHPGRDVTQPQRHDRQQCDRASCRSPALCRTPCIGSAPPGRCARALPMRRKAFSGVHSDSTRGATCAKVRRAQESGAPRDRRCAPTESRAVRRCRARGMSAGEAQVGLTDGAGLAIAAATAHRRHDVSPTRSERTAGPTLRTRPTASWPMTR